MEYNVKSDKLAELYPLKDRKLRFKTLQIHGGAPYKDPATNAKAVPIYQTSSFYILVGRTFYETYKERAFAMMVRLDILRKLGACMTPQSAWLLLQGLETLSLRVERHLSNTMALARYLDAHPMVAWVSYPGLPSHESHETAKRLFKGFGCVLSFGVKDGRGEDVMDNLKLHTLLANVGGVHSLIVHPASITRDTLDDEERLAGGVTSDIFRVSVGTEHIDDIIEDFEIAFAKLNEDIMTKEGSTPQVVLL